jgi:hypothetical protein
MKTRISGSVTGISLMVLFLMAGCEDRVYEEYYVMTPVYMSFEDLRKSVEADDPKEISQPGKIYLKDNFIFINEYFEGIHIIDNTDPGNPVVAGFITIPGNVDIAVAGNILYADSFTDLVVLDISDMTDIHEIDRIEDIFPYTVPETEGKMLLTTMVEPAKGVVVAWDKEKRKERVAGQSSRDVFIRFETLGLATFAGAKDAGFSAGSSAGQGGSMARFGIYDNYLYAIDHLDMHIFNIENFSSPLKSGSERIDWSIETMFIYGDKMFIGGQRGMYIYDLNDPAKPVHLSTYWHITSCDPVVVEGDIAYVTLRAGTFCGAGDNRLDVIDISDLRNPKLIKDYQMREPYGLGVDNKILFICEGNKGLVVYNAEDPLMITKNKIADFPGIHAYDVIPVNGVLLMIGLDGLYQYDYSDPAKIEKLSFIPVYSN